MSYAHDVHCNTNHTAGPEPCPPAREDVPTDVDIAYNDLTAALAEFRGVFRPPLSNENVGATFQRYEEGIRRMGIAFVKVASVSLNLLRDLERMHNDLKEKLERE